MSDDPQSPPAAPPPPPKDTRFKKGTSGNPRGRPRKPRQGITPTQLRKDILRVMELPISVKVGNKEEILTVREASIYSLAKRAIAGEKVAYVKLWIQLQQQVARDNVFLHPELLSIDLFDQILREVPPERRDKGIEESLKALIRKSKGL
ncbi:MAG: DUF5681 domain-containing protein [Sphingomicrobium sp.]